MLALPVESAIIMAIEEVEPILASLLMVEAMSRVLCVTTKLLIGEAVEGIAMPTMVGLSVVQAIVEALLATIETLVGKAVGEVVGEAPRVICIAAEGAYKVGITPMEVSSMVGPLVGIFLASENNQ